MHNAHNLWKRASNLRKHSAQRALSAPPPLRCLPPVTEAGQEAGQVPASLNRVGAGMSALGHKQTQHHHGAMSALPLKADIERHVWHVRFVPKADSCTAAKDVHGCKRVIQSGRRARVASWGPRRRLRLPDRKSMGLENSGSGCCQAPNTSLVRRRSASSSREMTEDSNLSQGQTCSTEIR
jgi:hypothetical protein